MISEFITAEEISKKTRALKHLAKKIKEVNKNGQAVIRLNNTGVELMVKKGGALYLELAAKHAELAKDIGSYEFVKRATIPSSQTSN